MRLQVSHAYLLLALLGAAVPLAAIAPWFATHGAEVGLLLDELFANRVSAFFGLDVILSAVVLLFLFAVESGRGRVPHLWLPAAGTLAVGVSFGLPLYLFLRERRAERKEA